MRSKLEYLNWAPLLIGAFFIPLLHTEMLYDHFSVIKWFAVNSLAILCLAHLLTFKKFPSPYFPNWAWSALGLSIVIFIMHFVLDHTRLVNFPLADRLSLLVLIYYFFIFFKSNKVDFKLLFYPTIAASTLVTLYGLYQVATMKATTDDFSSTFGNTNMTAQFLGFAILVQLFSIPWDEKRFAKLNLLRCFVFFISTVYLTLLMCRSISLGLIVCTPFLFLKLRPTRATFLCALAALAIATGVFLRAKPAESLQRTKQFELQNATTNQRWVMWSQSVRLLQDHPLGIGPASYEFGSIPYMINTDFPPQENLVFKSPHNEFLRFAVEDGIPFLFLMAAVWIWLLSTRIKKPWDTESVFYMVFAVLWLTEMSFQFPFENAYPSFLICIVAGRALAMNPLGKDLNPWLIRGCGALILCTLTFLASRMFYGKYLEGAAKGQMAIEKAACEVYPDNWRPCIAYAVNAMETNQWSAADETLRGVLERTPYNFAAIKAWGILGLRTHYKQQGCAAIWIYDQIFSSKSTIRPALEKHCSEESKKLLSIGLYQIYPKPLPKLNF